MELVAGLLNLRLSNTLFLIGVHGRFPIECYVTAFFIFPLCIDYWGVVALNAYFQSARRISK